jgi:thiosulfate reductase cytochrome b subunit
MPRHSLIARITHWLNAIAFVGLVISGFAILLAHPRLYWGETGNLETSSLIDLPLPFMLTGQSGWGRSLHFLSAWVCVLGGVIYLLFGFFAKHFRKNYKPVQRMTYLAVIFALFPLMIWTGLAMSPAITSVFPVLVTAVGGQQSARTIHFVVAASLLLFLFAHVIMVYRAGFVERVGAMITGRDIVEGESS